MSVCENVEFKHATNETAILNPNTIFIKGRIAVHTAPI